MYPNILTLIKICFTIPSISCKCEHNGTILRRVNTYMSQYESKPIIIVGNDAYVLYEKVDLDVVVDILARKHPRRIELLSVLIIIKVFHCVHYLFVIISFEMI